MNTQTILRGLKKHIRKYLRNRKPNVITDRRMNHLDFNISYPTDEQFQSFIFKTMKDMGLDVVMDGTSPYKIIYITLDGYKMPVITTFNLNDNVYDSGSIECSVWINENVKEPV